MPRRFEPVVRRVRFEVPGYSADQMLRIASGLVDSVRTRIEHGLDVYDQPAPPLAAGYAKVKARRAPPAIRNWSFTGRTLRSMKVLRAEHNKALIGFTDAETNRRAAINNRRVRQFGVSPANKAELVRTLETTGHPVKAIAV